MTKATEKTLTKRWEAIHRAILKGPDREVQELIDSGQAWRLEGHVGRGAMDALKSGAAVLPAKRVRDYYGTVVPSYHDVVDETGFNRIGGERRRLRPLSSHREG